MYRGIFKPKEVVAFMDNDADENALRYLGVCALKVVGATAGLLILDQLALPYLPVEVRAYILFFTPATLFIAAVVRVLVCVNRKLKADEDQW
jgi:hypothetical protein